MTKAHDRGQLDWLVELAGAAIPATAAAFAAARLAPLNGWSLSSAVLVGFGGVFAAAFAVMRIVPAEAHRLALPDFETKAVADEDSCDEMLLLDQPLLEAATRAVAELLLDDPLPSPTPDSRVVQLFADGRMPTAGQLMQRIDHHLADGVRPMRDVRIDAADALSDALAELRRSLRQA